MVKTRIKENQHERIPTSDRQDNHCGSYCDCGRFKSLGVMIMFNMKMFFGNMLKKQSIMKIY